MSAPTPAPPPDRVLALFERWIARVLPPPQYNWYRAALAEARCVGSGDVSVFAGNLALVPRRIGLADLPLDPTDLAEAETLRPGFDPSGISVDQAARIGLLLASHRTDVGFAARLTTLCRHADLRAHVAYLRGLPLYPAPTLLRTVAEAGIRSAITPVFEAVAHRNPLPAEIFDEAVWNQMILKAVFIGSPLAPIQSFDRRGNPALAAMLRDYVREREAAGRDVSDELRRCVNLLTSKSAPKSDYSTKQMNS